MKSICINFGILFLTLLVYSCEEKPNAPTVTTSEIKDISYTTATSGGEATADGGSPITSKGICWNTSAEPVISNDKTNEGSGLGSYSSLLTYLTPNTKYYVRAYATNSVGTSYGNQLTFNTNQLQLATVSTFPVTSVGLNSAICGGSINSDGGAPITSRGVCWKTTQNPTIEDSKTTDGEGVGQYISNLSNLGLLTKYYVRAYATNTMGTAYGQEISFTTASEPTAITITPVLIENTSATLTGTINPNNSETTVVFEFGTTSSYEYSVTVMGKSFTRLKRSKCKQRNYGISFGPGLSL